MRMHSRTQTRWLRRVSVLALAAGMLAGCANGLAPDAERGRRADEQRDSVVRDLQATEAWNLIHGTPESTPEPED
jgi:hypothetical protein